MTTHINTRTSPANPITETVEATPSRYISESAAEGKVRRATDAAWEATEVAVQAAKAAKAAWVKVVEAVPDAFVNEVTWEEWVAATDASRAAWVAASTSVAYADAAFSAARAKAADAIAAL